MIYICIITYVTPLDVSKKILPISCITLQDVSQYIFLLKIFTLVFDDEF